MKKYLSILVLLISASVLHVTQALPTDINGFPHTELENARFRDHNHMEVIEELGIYKNNINRYNAINIHKNFPALRGSVSFMTKLNDIKRYNQVDDNELYSFQSEEHILRMIADSFPTREEVRRCRQLGNDKQLADEAEDRKRQTLLEQIKVSWQGAKIFFNKQRFMYFGIVVCSIIFFYYMAKYGIRYLFGKKPPVIIKETSLPTTWRERLHYRLSQWFPSYFTFKKKRLKSRYKDLMYNDDVMKVLKEEIEMTKQIVKEKCKKGKGSKFAFGSTILVGPPGVGKTLFAKVKAAEAAKEAKKATKSKLSCHYIIIDGPRWAQMDTKDALKNYYELKDYLESIEGFTIAFIDEADAVFEKRQGSSELGQKLTSAFLGTHEKSFNDKIEWIFATNYIENFDEALSDRLGKVIEIPLPDEATCYDAHKHYLSKETKKFKVDFAFDLEDYREELGKASLGLSQRVIEGIAKVVVQKCYLYKMEVSYDLLKEAIASRQSFKDKHKKVRKNVAAR